MLNKRLGQHFLRDEAVLAAIAAAIAPAAGQTIIEIGPGDGALTRHLEKSGARIVALEIDRRFAAALQQRYRSSAHIRIVCADALRADWRQLAGAQSRLAGNLPYNISTPLLLKMAHSSGWLGDCHVMVQKEVAERVCAAPGGAAYGRLSVSLQLFFQPQLLFEVPPDAFQPPPAVSSAALRLQAKAAPPLPPRFEEVLAAAFAQRRKTLKNALAALPLDWRRCPIDGQRRAQTLSPDEFIALARCVESDS